MISFDMAEVNIFAAVVCLFLMGNIARGKNRFQRFGSIAMMLGLNVLLLLFDTLYRISGAFPQPQALYLMKVSAFFYYIFCGFLPFCGALYVETQVLGMKRRIRRGIVLLSIPLAVSVLLALINPFTYVLYRIDDSGVCHRGPLLTVYFLVCASYVVYLLFLLGVNRQRMEPRLHTCLLVFLLPPLICGALQLFVKHLDILWPSATLSLLLLYVWVADDTINTDYLTGLYTRLQVDEYMRRKIRRACKGVPFAGILIDIDRFKEINDHFGHNAGDNALHVAAGLMKKCIGPRDLLARYGGDEFLILLDEGTPGRLAKVMRKVRTSFDAYNETPGRGYPLTVSVGGSVYEAGNPLSVAEFINRIDLLMYEDKHRRRGATE